MAYEMRIAGRPSERFDTSKEAETRARELMLENAETEVDIIDLSTGRPYAPGASAADRQDMARKIGY